MQFGALELRIRVRTTEEQGVFGVGALGAILLGGSAAGEITVVNDTVNAGFVAMHDADEIAMPAAQEWQTGGLAVADFNRDGHQDIFWIGGGGTADKLFLNDGMGHFVDAAAAWGIAAPHCGNGAAVGDYNGDGWPDLYVTSFGAPGVPGVPGSHRLYLNDGGTVFTNVAAAGVNFSCPGTNPAGYGAAFGDYDLDGDLDLFVTSWWGGDDGNRLYRNNGNGTFTDVTAASIGAALDGVWGFQPAFVDMDGDRYPELLIAADFETSRYLVNDADGTFTDMTVPSGTGLDDNGMGQAVGDFNHDGRFDWYVTSVWMSNPPPDSNVGNMFYLAIGEHLYFEASVLAGINDGRWGWGTIAVDLNQDTWLDIVEVNGRPAPGSEWINQRGKLFRNNGTGLSYTDVALAAGFDHTDEGRGLAYLDADGDGDLDFVVSTNDGPPALYINETPNIGHWLMIDLDTSTNARLAPDGFGTLVRATAGAVTQRQYMNSAPSYLSTSQLVVHFGLGAATVVNELRVEWTSGAVTTLTGVAADQHVTITAPVPADFDADGDVDVVDLLELLGGWGPCPAAPAPCLSDVDGDGQTGVTDLLAVLAAWG